MKKEIIIRQAVLKDSERIFALIHRFPDELVQRPLSEIIQNIDRFLVAETNGCMVGCCSYKLLPEFGTPIHASVEVQSLAVLSTTRHCGAGSALVNAVIEKVKSFHAAEVLVLTMTPEFFGKLGFVEVPKSEVMHKIYTGCIHCMKHANPFTCPEVAMIRKLGDE